MTTVQVFKFFALLIVFGLIGAYLFGSMGAVLGALCGAALFILLVIREEKGRGA